MAEEKGYFESLKDAYDKAVQPIKVQTYENSARLNLSWFVSIVFLESMGDAFLKTNDQHYYQQWRDYLSAQLNPDPLEKLVEIARGQQSLNDIKQIEADKKEAKDALGFLEASILDKFFEQQATLELGQKALLSRINSGATNQTYTSQGLKDANEELNKLYVKVANYRVTLQKIIGNAKLMQDPDILEEYKVAIDGLVSTQNSIITKQKNLLNNLESEHIRPTLSNKISPISLANPFNYVAGLLNVVTRGLSYGAIISISRTFPTKISTEEGQTTPFLQRVGYQVGLRLFQGTTIVGRALSLITAPIVNISKAFSSLGNMIMGNKAGPEENKPLISKTNSKRDGARYSDTDSALVNTVRVGNNTTAMSRRMSDNPQQAAQQLSIAVASSNNAQTTVNNSPPQQPKDTSTPKLADQTSTKGQRVGSTFEAVATDNNVSADKQLERESKISTHRIKTS